MPHRITGNLHKFRHSTTGAVYFVTCCTVGRGIGLTDEPLRQAIHHRFADFDETGDVETLAATVMPDHIHWLFKLGPRLRLGRVLARFKAEMRATLATRALEWQRDFFEHQLRPEENVEDYGLYIFLNPYRAALIGPVMKWPGWHCSNPKHFNFLHRLNSDDTPPSEWVEMPVPGTLVAGE